MLSIVEERLVSFCLMDLVTVVEVTGSENSSIGPGGGECIGPGGPLPFCLAPGYDVRCRS